LATLAVATLGIPALAACGADSAPLSLAPEVDLSRYAGRWYVIANIPYFAENGNVGSYFDISFRPDDKLTDVYTAHPKTALIGYPGRGYGWVFARKPVIDDATYQSLLCRLRDKGYDVSPFRRGPQVPEQIGNPGFQ
jgi:apolipoprotein D and lipocalin family protein